MADERVELGYRYCTRPDCQARHHRGVEITTVGVNKSADSVVAVGGAAERPPTETPVVAHPARARTRSAVVTPPRLRWTPEQEKLVRLYHDMGLSPRRIAERAARNAPRLGVTERLVVQILSAPRR